MNYDYERDWNHEKIMNQFVVKIASKDFQFWEVTLIASTNTNICVLDNFFISISKMIKVI